ncbi:MAG: hypothetical protein L0Z50_32735, partial [Verrucomicrobiales bacterium]|nr:hypothetical protein [Verrucomicrobiales bacterium]
GGDWNDPANWSTGKLPGPEDSVFIDVPDKEAVIVLRGTRGALRPFHVRSLASNEEIALLYADLHVDEPMQLNNILSISGSKVTDTVLRGGPKAVLAWRGFGGSSPETPERYLGALVRATLEGDFQSWEAFNVVERLTLNNANVYGIRLENGLPEPKPSGAGAGWLFWEGAVVDGTGTFNNFRINSWSQAGFPGGFTVTLSPGVTMRGHTEIIFNPSGGTLINQGTISAGYLEPAPPPRPDIPLPVLSQITIGDVFFPGRTNSTFINEGTVEFRNYARAQLQSSQGSPVPLPAIINRGVLRVTENAALSIHGDLVSGKMICDSGAVCRIEANARLVTAAGQVSELSGTGYWFVLGEFLGGTVRATQGAVLEGSPIFSDVTLEGELRNYYTAAALTPRLMQLPPHARWYAGYGVYVEVKTNLTLNGLIRFHRAPEEFGGGLLFSRLLGSRNDRLGGNGRVVFDRASSPHGMGGIVGNITIDERITIEGHSLYLGPAITHNRGTILSDQSGDSLEFIGGITNSGTIRLGTSMLVTNRAQFAQTPAGQLVILASGTQPGVTHAQMKNGFFGSMILDGTLVLETLDPFQPRAGDVFELLQYTKTPAVQIPRTGMFASDIAPAPPPGLEWIPEYGPASFRLRLGN